MTLVVAAVVVIVIATAVIFLVVGCVWEDILEFIYIILTQIHTLEQSIFREQILHDTLFRSDFVKYNQISMR